MFSSRSNFWTLRDERTKLEVLLERCVQPSIESGSAGGGTLLIPRRTRQPLQVSVSAIRGATVLWRPAAAIIVLINDLQRRVRPAHDLLRKLFGLTPPECRVALLLADGHSTREITSVVGVSANTIKSQLSAIFVKTGTSRQAELVKMLTLLRTNPMDDTAIVRDTDCEVTIRKWSTVLCIRSAGLQS